LKRQCNLCCKIVFDEEDNPTKGNTTMKNDNVISLEKPEENEDILTGLLQQGARVNGCVKQRINGEAFSRFKYTG